MATWKEKVIFVDFKKMILRNSKNTSQKRIFQTSLGPVFRSVENFPRIFLAYQAYKKYFLEYKQTFGIT